MYEYLGHKVKYCRMAPRTGSSLPRCTVNASAAACPAFSHTFPGNHVKSDLLSFPYGFMSISLCGDLGIWPSLGSCRVDLRRMTERGATAVRAIRDPNALCTVPLSEGMVALGSEDGGDVNVLKYRCVG